MIELINATDESNIPECLDAIFVRDTKLIDHLRDNYNATTGNIHWICKQHPHQE